MSMFKTTSAKTPEQYFAMIEEPRKSQIQLLHNFITSTIPDQKPYIISGMIGYGSYQYKTASGKGGDWCIIALASQKNYISLYICPSDGKEYVPEKYTDRLPNADIGKSCIRFKKTGDIDLKVIKEAILEGVKAAKKYSV
jgi:hypothetical protein